MRSFAGFLKQSTSTTICIGPFVSKTDDYTPQSGLVTGLDGATGLLVSKNGGSLALRGAGFATSSYDANGYYKLNIGASDCNTLGLLSATYTEVAVCKPVAVDFVVLPPNVYDSMIGNTTNLQVDSTKINGSASGAAAISDLGLLGYSTATKKLTGVVLVDTVTNLTNSASSGDFNSTQKASITTAVNAATGMVAASVTNPVTVSGDFSATMKTSLSSGVRYQIDQIPIDSPVAASLGYLNANYIDAAISSRLGPTGVLSTVTNLTNTPGTGDFTAAQKISLVSGVNAASGMVAASVAGSVGSVVSKTGFKLASDGLDAVAAPTDLANDTAARATFMGMIRALFNRFYNSVSQSATQQVVRNDTATGVSTMPVSVASGVETKGKSS